MDTQPDLLRVLVVEDDEGFADLLGEMLEAEGCVVESVGGGWEALARLSQPPTPELIVLDLVLPGLDGWAFYVESRLNPKVPQVPVIVLTGARSAPDISLVGLLDFIRKPVAPPTRADCQLILREQFRDHLAQLKARRA